MDAGRVTFLLILLLCTAWISIGQAIQGGIPVSSDLAVTSAATNNKRMVIINRKLLKGFMKGAAEGSYTSKFSSINSKCGNKNLAAGGCEQSVTHFSNEVEDHDQSGFVAFNADYHAPRHHPPKNN
ncbi:hypothetical protein CCACVL1_06416 [Corchorus capsularis]|uniref:Uncharacterized protein n=1 Tax=Corchorus capsularis TaxID=210143 RepID=A0A1R3JFP4_COCAP|nr:hypothetical protein CCACVL1_06416 [Corchorus capsularis]